MVTIVGLITISGIIATGWLSIRKNVQSRVAWAWGGFVAIFIAISASFALGISGQLYDLMYTISAIAAIISLIIMFRDNGNWAVGFLIMLYGLNIAGNWLGVDVFKVANVDLLDIFAWAQLLLFVKLSNDYRTAETSEEPKVNNQRDKESRPALRLVA